MKHCKKCRQTKPLADFYRDNAARDGHRPECKSCTSSRRQAWYAANRKHEIARVVAWQQHNRERYNTRQREYKSANRNRERAGYLNRKFGLSLEQFHVLLEAQQDSCVICGAKPKKSNLHVDHDHDTGVVRGLLCFRCNGGLGQFKEDAERLLRAVEYLDRGTHGLIEADELTGAARARALALRS